MRGSVSVPFMPHAGHCPSGVPGVPLILRVVGAKALFTVLAIDERVGEPGDVAARLPHARVHEDGRIEPLDVVARADHRVPPPVLDVPLELDAERAVVPHGPGAAIDLGRLERRIRGACRARRAFRVCR